jgi:hypothetical protein
MNMQVQDKEMFNQIGRRKNTNNYRLFEPEDLTYYQIKNSDITYQELATNYQLTSFFPEIQVDIFELVCESLKRRLSALRSVAPILNGVCIPFALPRLRERREISEIVLDDYLPFLERSYHTNIRDGRFNVIVQGGSTLMGNLRIAKNSQYENLIESNTTYPLYGLYFPQALQQFDIQSQIRQMAELPTCLPLCLSGPMEVLSVLIGKPDLLINEESYCPILCMSAVEHVDYRLALVIKSYGCNLELWAMSQMVTPTLKQVSEQWSGGITVFSQHLSAY